MANPQNLIPNSERTPSERKENCTKAGIASGKARREKKKLAQALREMMDEKIADGLTRQEAFLKKALANSFNGSPNLDDLLKIQKLMGEEKTTIETEIKMPNFNITEE